MATATEVPVGIAVRIGITRAADKLFRFYERGNPFVSGPKRLLRSDATPTRSNG
jgi:DNA-3-methyladenine glycosylase